MQDRRQVQGHDEASIREFAGCLVGVKPAGLPTGDFSPSLRL